MQKVICHLQENTWDISDTLQLVSVVLHTSILFNVEIIGVQKNLLCCGNFNMTNIDGEMSFDKLTLQGQCPRIYSDSYIMLERMGHRLDREVERNFIKPKALGWRTLISPEVY